MQSHERITIGTQHGPMSHICKGVKWIHNGDNVDNEGELNQVFRAQLHNFLKLNGKNDQQKTFNNPPNDFPNLH